MTSWNSVTRDVVAGAVINGIVINGVGAGSTASPMANDSTASVSGSGTESKTPSTLVSSVVYDRNWENDMESLLKVRASFLTRPSFHHNFVMCRICTMRSRTNRCWRPWVARPGPVPRHHPLRLVALSFVLVAFAVRVTVSTRSSEGVYEVYNLSLEHSPVSVRTAAIAASTGGLALRLALLRLPTRHVSLPAGSFE